MALADTGSIDCKSVLEQSPALAASQPIQLEGAESFVYEQMGDASLRLHVFSPPYHRQSDQSAAIVFFFGGGWAFGTVYQFVPQAQYLSQRGMVAIVADYRVRCRHGSGPEEAMADARAAMRWVRSHASTLGIDPNRLVASGGSAGGHLAVSTALFEGAGAISEDQSTSSQPNALILFNPWLGAMTPTAKPYLPADPKSVQAIAPAEHLRKGMPPTLILQGRADTATPYAAALSYCEKARSMRGECKVVGYDGAEHGFFNAPNFGLPHNPDNPEKKAQNDWYRQTLFEADKFLSKLGYFSTQPNAAGNFNSSGHL